MRLTIILLLAITSVAFGAVDFGSYRHLGYVNDFAEVIDPVDRANLEKLLAQVHRKYLVEFGFVSVPSVERYRIGDVTKYFYEQWDMGRASNNQSALVLISADDGKLHLYVGMGLRGVINSKWIAGLSDEASNLLVEKKYSLAAVGVVTELVKRVAAKSDALPRPSARLVENMGDMSAKMKATSAPIAILGAVGLGVLLVVTTLLKAGQEKSVYEKNTGGDFERNRAGPFGNKKPRWL